MISTQSFCSTFTSASSFTTPSTPEPQRMSRAPHVSAPSPRTSPLGNLLTHQCSLHPKPTRATTRIRSSLTPLTQITPSSNLPPLSPTPISPLTPCSPVSSRSNGTRQTKHLKSSLNHRVAHSSCDTCPHSGNNTPCSSFLNCPKQMGHLVTLTPNKDSLSLTLPAPVTRRESTEMMPGRRVARASGVAARDLPGPRKAVI